MPRGAFSGSDPFNDSFGAPLPPQLQGEAPRKCFALVTARDEFFATIAYPNEMKPHRMRIAWVGRIQDSLPPMGVLTDSS